MKPQDYLPKKPQENVLMQARIPRKLFVEVREFMQKHSITWSEMTIASFKKFIDDMKKEKS